MKSYSGMLFAFLSAFFVKDASANVECPPAKVHMIKKQEGVALIKLEGQNWHILAKDSDKKSNKLLRKAYAAKQKEQKIALSFANGYNPSCLVSDYSYSVKNIKIIKNNN